MGAVQPAAASDDRRAAHGDSVLDAGLAPGADSPLALSISPKRALVSLAFLGALFARRVRRGDASADTPNRHAHRSR